MNSLAVIVAVVAGLTVCGLLIVIGGMFAVHRFVRLPSPRMHERPPVSVLKPLCGAEPMLEAALASICSQDYPGYQVIFGVQEAHDPALQVVARMRHRYPACDIAVVVDPTLHGPNRKVGNLINMLPLARHDVLVFSDSDLHVAPDYLASIVAALEPAGVGLVTAMCMGLPTSAGIAARLGATAISHSFLPGVLISRTLGREDCLGTSMALRRETLARAGGLECLVRHLADDNVLARQVQRLGLQVVLASTVPMTGVPETSLRAIWHHELRWARTIRSLEPILFAASALQYPLFWAALTVALSGGAFWAAGLFAFTWAMRAVGVRQIERAFARRTGSWMWLLPFRDVLSVCEVAASYLGGRVVWRGHVMQVDPRPTFEAVPIVSRTM